MSTSRRLVTVSLLIRLLKQLQSLAQASGDLRPLAIPGQRIFPRQMLHQEASTGLRLSLSQALSLPEAQMTPLQLRGTVMR